MLELLAAALAGTGLPQPCRPEALPDDGHHADVCSAWIGGRTAYSASFAASLVPQPAFQQVLIYRRDDGWTMRIAGYRWEPGGAFETRRREVRIPPAEAERIAGRMTQPMLARLADLPFYGAGGAICMDGATTTLTLGEAGMQS